MGTINKIPYHQDENKFFRNLQTQKIIEWIAPNSSMLEFGCHTGLLSKILIQEKQAEVTGVELNAAALDLAKPYQKESFCLDIEDCDNWYNLLKGKKYDSIFFLHILEHIRNPEAVLEQSLKLLKPGGKLIIGLPNVSNAKERFDMLFGKFEYTEIGVMDRTHISMFNYYTALNLIDEAGLVIEEYFSPWQVNPVKQFFDHLPVLWRFSKKMKQNPGSIFRPYPNLTDAVMLFKCSLT